jgi:hypothetical protein
MGRWLRFFFIIALGIFLGLLYGWVISPVQYVNTAPSTLREDYQTDYVLMVAEAYRADNNLALAVRRLALLGGDPPEELVRRASLLGTKYNYPEQDLALMQVLHRELLTWNPAMEVPRP